MRMTINMNDNNYILIIDDFQNWLDLLFCFLDRQGYPVITAYNLEKAKEALLNNDISIIILDMRLIDNQKYDTQGFELLKYVKEMNPLIGTIILTGYPSQEQKQLALDTYKADAYLCKTTLGSFDDAFTLKKLQTLIKELTERSLKY